MALMILHPCLCFAQAPIYTQITICPSGIDSDIQCRQLSANNYAGLIYDPARCNIDGPLGVSYKNHVVTYDDPYNDNKVCIADISELLNGLPPASSPLPPHSYFVQTTYVYYAIGIDPRKHWGYHASEDFLLGPDDLPTAVSCQTPFGKHAPALFITAVETAGQKSRISFQLSSPDDVSEIAAQINGVDANIISGTKLNDIGSIWFNNPVAGSYTIGMRALNNYNCSIIRNYFKSIIIK